MLDDDSDGMGGRIGGGSGGGGGGSGDPTGGDGMRFGAVSGEDNEDDEDLLCDFEPVQANESAGLMDSDGGADLFGVPAAATPRPMGSYMLQRGLSNAQRKEGVVENKHSTGVTQSTRRLHYLRYELSP
jgi:hypothetical protein